MADRPNNSQAFADGMAVGVAIIGRDARGELVVTACNDHFFRMTGAAPPHRRTFPIPFDTLAPDHGRLELREKLEAGFRSGETEAPEQTCDWRNGSQCWRLSLEPLTRADGDATAREMLVTGVDLAPKARQTHELEVNASRFRAVVDSAYDAIVTIDQQHNIAFFNRAAENLFGYTSDEVLGQPLVMLLPEQSRARHPQHVRQFAGSPQADSRSMSPPRMDESNSVYGRHRDGTIIPVEISISRINVDGEVEFMAVIRDITDRHQLMELLRQQAATDALTGLPNRRECLDFIEKVLATDDVLSVFILDIDFFKKINDSYGHDIGDEVLRVLAMVGMSIPYESRLFARWGGEEFVAVLSGAQAGADAARRIAEALRLRFEQQDFEHTWRVKPIPFTVSIGVVTREPGERDVDALMRRADQALYRAKESGRNRVEVG